MRNQAFSERAPDPPIRNSTSGRVLFSRIVGCVAKVVSVLPPTICRRSLLVDCWYELQEYVHASGLAQRRAEEQGNNFVIC